MYQDLWTKKSVSECFFVAADRDAGGKILRREEHWPEGSAPARPPHGGGDRGYGSTRPLQRSSMPSSSFRPA